MDNLHLEMAGSRYLIVTAFVSGAIVMVVELIGSRIIGPPFGVSLFVWTSLITVTLVSLAVGYWLGGRLADAVTSPAALYAIVLAAGVTLLFIPLVKNFVIDHSIPLGLRAGSLVSSTVLFAPTLLLLGMVTPYIVKLYMSSDLGRVGKTVGWLYAVSTCGSFIGTVATGFVLIPSLGVNSIIYCSSISLIALTAGYRLVFYRRAYVAALAAVPLALLLVPADLPSVTRPDGTVVSLVMNDQSRYGQIKVVDYSYGDLRFREFLMDNIVQGAIDVNTGLPITEYTYNITRLARAYNAGASRALVIGLGAGIVPEVLTKRYGMETDVVEIDPEVAETAARYFNYDPESTATHIMDGRYFLKTTTSKFDVIVLDAFSGDITPSHLISEEAFELIASRLNGGGVLIINFLGGNSEEDMVVPGSLSRTLKKAFTTVDVYVPKTFYGPERTVVNYLFVAYNGDRRQPVLSDPSPEPVHPYVAGQVATLFDRRISIDDGPLLFTDNYNPVDFYDMKLRERIRSSVIMTTDRKILLD
ncbi:MAG: fused MFS/spermidine synthase [Thermodesulfobacteriota bacterium]